MTKMSPKKLARVIELVCELRSLGCAVSTVLPFELKGRSVNELERKMREAVEHEHELKREV